MVAVKSTKAAKSKTYSTPKTSAINCAKNPLATAINEFAIVCCVKTKSKPRELNAVFCAPETSHDSKTENKMAVEIPPEIELEMLRL